MTSYSYFKPLYPDPKYHSPHEHIGEPDLVYFNPAVPNFDYVNHNRIRIDLEVSKAIDDLYKKINALSTVPSCLYSYITFSELKDNSTPIEDYLYYTDDDIASGTSDTPVPITTPWNDSYYNVVIPPKTDISLPSISMATNPTYGVNVLAESEGITIIPSTTVNVDDFDGNLYFRIELGDFEYRPDVPDTYKTVTVDNVTKFYHDIAVCKIELKYSNCSHCRTIHSAILREYFVPDSSNPNIPKKTTSNKFIVDHFTVIIQNNDSLPKGTIIPVIYFKYKLRYNTIIELRNTNCIEQEDKPSSIQNY